MHTPPIDKSPTGFSLPQGRLNNVQRPQQKTRREQSLERRRQPDRRRKQIAAKHTTERRHRRDRRQPELLNAATARPESIASPKGRTINIRA